MHGPRQRLHGDEVYADAAQVRRLLRAQFPRWSELPLFELPGSGTDHALYRLGPSLAVRLPRRAQAALQVDAEQRWLPRLAPALPLAVPVPLERGTPGEGYPWPWSIVGWIEGDAADAAAWVDPLRAARTLGQFLVALRGVDPEGAPAPGPRNSGRGEPLANRDATTRAAIGALGDAIDAPAALAAWQAALATPAWQGAGRWLHGDMLPGNVLLQGGQPCAVIDWGCCGVGDPACDLMSGWTLFSGTARAAFREASQADAAAWARGRGWALSFGLIALPYYMHSHPPLAAVARRAIDAVLAEARPGAPRVH